MCPISGSMQLLTVLLVLLLFCYRIVAQWTLKFQPLTEPIHMDEMVSVGYNLTGPNTIHSEHYLSIKSLDPHIATAEKEIWLRRDNYTDFHIGTFNITGSFLGQTWVQFSMRDSTGNTTEINRMDVTVIRKQRVIDRVFTASTATLVALIYVNFGCALDWPSFRSNLKKPIGPAIGFFTQFGIMPVLSYVIGLVIFPGDVNMQLGMFFSGVAPGGGASNIWTVLLDGNLDLSVTMSAISNVAAFGMMPLWIFTLGKEIFNRGDLEIPYSQISTYAVALIGPLIIGLLIQRYLKRFAAFMARILKGFSALLIIFIVVFAIVTNLYLFELFSWQIIVAGMGLPWLGYMLGYLAAFVLKRNPVDCLTIAIETGIQNTGIAIFMLRFSLQQPQADLTTVVPVSIAIMTPLPLLCLYVYKKVSTRLSMRRKKLECSGVDEPLEVDIDNNLNKERSKEITTIS